MSSVRRNRFLNLLSLVIEDRSTAIKALILLVVQGIAAATAPRLLGVAVDKAETDGFTPIFLVGVSYLMVELVRISSSRLQAVEFSRIGQGAVHRLRVRLFDHVMKLSWSDLKRIGPTDLLSRLTVDIRSISSLFEACFLRIIERLVSVIAILIGIISISPTLGGGAVGLLPIVFIGSWFSSKRLYAAFYERQAAFSAVMTSISDSVELADEIKILELSKKRLAHFLTQSSRLAEVQKIPQYFFGRLHASMSILSAISVGTILILGQSYIADGSLSKGQLVTLVAYTGSIFWPIIVIIDQWSVLLQGLASADRLFEIFETSSKNLPFSDLSSLKNNGSKSAVFSELQGPPPMVLFKDISFRYPETGRGVASLNFSIKQGERVGIVGATGSGKSTIYRLLLRLVQPDSGEIFVDGEDLELIDENKLRQMVGFMPQHPEIFSGKAHENITLEFFAENTSGDRILGVGRLLI
jgi:ATP-binding cassette subfamily B protein